MYAQRAEPQLVASSAAANLGLQEVPPKRRRTEPRPASLEPVNAFLDRTYGVGYRLFRRQGGRSALGLGRLLQGRPWPLGVTNARVPGSRQGCGAPGVTMSLENPEFTRAILRDADPLGITSADVS